ncbi:hypothetical protein MFMK1_002136 [Metallumcola ferriviriculae]|uniref:4Fe-4S ferredoxin-type domain-containing protein n=1 Tax=Metallumcola ferriviriculae TaxID=3039180 RepID=A0AAU0UNW8_9FIRM|nr:hypothetical protein MFMK1_002136 [Desulfitibacteraceae bacterium MK1]
MEVKLKEFAKSQGVDIVGIAEPSAIPDYFPERKLEVVLPNVKAVVVFGIRMLWGSISNSNYQVATSHTNATYEELHGITYRIGRYMETLGYDAASIAPHIPVEMSKETKGLSGEISLRHAAVGAGLGVLGKSRLLITKELGPRVRLGAVVTNAPLKGDKVLYYNPCGHCKACINNCPSGALSDKGTNVTKCFLHLQPHGLGNYGKWLRELDASDSEKWDKAFSSTDFWNYYQAQSLGMYYNCFKCLTSCPVARPRVSQ